MGIDEEQNRLDTLGKGEKADKKVSAIKGKEKKHTKIFITNLDEVVKKLGVLTPAKRKEGKQRLITKLISIDEKTISRKAGKFDAGLDKLLAKIEKREAMKARLEKLKTSTSHEEGCERKWSLSTRRFLGDMQHITGLELIEVEWERDEKGQMQMKEISGTEQVVEADLVLLAMGFVHPVQEGIIDALDLNVNARKNIVTDTKFATSHEKVFAAGDARNGASLVVTAIYSGREAAAAIDDYLRNS